MIVRALTPPSSAASPPLLRWRYRGGAAASEGTPLPRRVGEGATVARDPCEGCRRRGGPMCPPCVVGAFCRPSGAGGCCSTGFLGLTPKAIDCRPFGAPNPPASPGLASIPRGFRPLCLRRCRIGCGPVCPSGVPQAPDRQERRWAGRQSLGVPWSAWAPTFGPTTGRDLPGSCFRRHPAMASTSRRTLANSSGRSRTSPFSQEKTRMLAETVAP